MQQVPGLEKAKLYMESVTYFMRHGGAIEVRAIEEGSEDFIQTISFSPA